MSELEEYREKINEIDYKIVHLFEKRMNFVRKIGDYKKKHNLPVLDPEREKEVIKKNKSYLKNEEYECMVEEFFKKIMELSKRLEK
ncbi:chorismate mutase [Garciella nitratireducens]|uniref:chorismate mutase n=1 Tax=Garciella nitratireducens TaxID=218205 RepID=UPI000DEAC2D5|nr:chorismate mutase [Garciella nitratireducens]RBP40245.1 chorismate mutase [Garciella nitratireducens]